MPRPSSPQCEALRAAGLKVTSARLAALRLAPPMLAERGSLTPRELHGAMNAAGYAVSVSALHDVLARLQAAGLLPDVVQPSRASQIASARSARSPLAGAPDDDDDPD